MGKIFNEIDVDVRITQDKNILTVHVKGEMGYDLMGYEIEQVQKDIWEFADRKGTPSELIGIEKEISKAIVDKEF